MNIQDLRQLTPEELGIELQNLKADLQATREAIRGGKEKNHAKLRVLRTQIARTATVIVETSKQPLPAGAPRA